jgi:hypothetical protein
LVAGSAIAQQVTYQYVSQSFSEVVNWNGYVSPSGYLDQDACTDGVITTSACGQTMEISSSQLQGFENSYNLSTKHVLAHEVGHNIQFKYGIYSQAPYQELQADCVGGAFDYYGENTLGYQGLLDSAVGLSYAIGGDPAHGTGAQRAYYTRQGYNTGGNLAQCF